MTDPTTQRRIDRIKAAVSIEQLFRFFSFDVGAEDGDRKVCCPFHDDQHPSAQLFVSQNMFWCWVCGMGGDVIWVVRTTLGRDFLGTLGWLEHNFVPELQDFEVRFQIATENSAGKIGEFSAERYWWRRHRLLLDHLAELLPDRFHFWALSGALEYVYDELDGTLATMRCGGYGEPEVKAVFDWAHRVVDVLATSLAMGDFASRDV